MTRLPDFPCAPAAACSSRAAAAAGAGGAAGKPVLTGLALSSQSTLQSILGPPRALPLHEFFEAPQKLPVI
ncbi:unnamed protein product [Closterium sp. NIES-54]